MIVTNPLRGLNCKKYHLTIIIDTVIITFKKAVICVK